MKDQDCNTIMKKWIFFWKRGKNVKRKNLYIVFEIMFYKLMIVQCNVDVLFDVLTVEEGGVMGKLSCVACKARLGSFSWAGVQCSCGVWVVPAFQLHKSRIDASRF